MAETKETLLSPEQMVIWRQKHHNDAIELNADNRKKFNRKIRKELEGMSPSELSATQSAMQAEWDALDPDKKAKFLGRIAEKAQKTADKLSAVTVDEPEG